MIFDELVIFTSGFLCALYIPIISPKMKGVMEDLQGWMAKNLVKQPKESKGGDV